MIDYNPSMYFGTRVAFKSVIATRIAALIGWATVFNGDRIGAFLFSLDQHQDIEPGGGRSGVLRLIRNLVQWVEPPDARILDSESRGLGLALQRLRRVARPGSLVFILSDFYSLDDDSEHHLARLRQHNDIIACRIADALELAPPPPGRYGVSDGYHTRILDTPHARSTAALQSLFQHPATALARCIASPLCGIDDVSYP